MITSMFINNQWLEGEGESLTVYEPATAQPFAQLEAASESQVDQAICAARAAFPGWRDTPAKERARLLYAFAEQLALRRETLATLIMRNNGKPRHEAEADVDDAQETFAYYARLTENLDDQQDRPIDVSAEGIKATLRTEALGVVGQIVPWNFPLVTSAWKMAPAIAAGCTMVLKTSEVSPLAELYYGEIAQAVKLPRGVINILIGGRETGQAITQHKGLNKLSFTGSYAAGCNVMIAAAKRCLPVTLELGGKSPVIVFDDCDLDQAVKWILAGICWNAGQMCSATSRLLVHSSIADVLYDKLLTAMQALVTGDPHSQDTEMGPMTSQAQWLKVQEYFTVAQQEGLRCLTGGEVLIRDGWFVAPTLYTDVPTRSRLWQEEIFGPVLCARTFSNEADAIKQANDCDYGLVATVITADNDRAGRVAKALEVGHVWINAPQRVFVETSWGGTKGSGIGRELGPWGLASYQSVKHITDNDEAISQEFPA